MCFETDSSAAGVASDDEGVSFVVPRWGGVVIYPFSALSPHDNATTTLSAAALLRPCERFLEQLRVMLGLPASLAPRDAPSTAERHSSGSVRDGVAAAQRHQSRWLVADAGVADWEVDALTRRRLRDALREVPAQLHDLYQLVARVPHMPVLPEVGRLVERALARFDAAVALLALPQPPPPPCPSSSASTACHAASTLPAPALRASALRLARRALNAAQRAFAHSSMLPSLYFPDEHLLAVVAPFFAPVVVHVVGAWLRRARSPRTAAAAA